MQTTTTDNATDSGELYHSRRPVISFYDLFVLWFSNTYVWKCPTKVMLNFYNKHISANHLDVGVGTGYFLDKCNFPSAKPKVSIADLNERTLARARKRLARYQPVTYLVNALNPLMIDATFDSIGFGYVLHFLPGPMLKKEVAFRNLKAKLNPQGVLFGTTILGKDVPQGVLARNFMSYYNQKRIFSNTEDSLADLKTVLGQHFQDYTVDLVGCVALFAGRL